MLGKLWDIAEDNLVWVSLLVGSSLIGIRWDGSNDFGVSVFELGMSSEVLSFFGVLIGVSHRKRA